MRIRYLPLFGLALASFAAGEILQGGECRLVIVERHKELLVGGQVPFGAPLQMTSK
jgi:hypothetical protein